MTLLSSFVISLSLLIVTPHSSPVGGGDAPNVCLPTANTLQQEEEEEEKAKYVNDPHSGSEGGGNAPITLDANRR